MWSCRVICYSKAGVPVVLDVGGHAVPLGMEICPFLTVLSPNETELARITQMPTETKEQVCTVLDEFCGCVVALLLIVS